VLNVMQGLVIAVVFALLTTVFRIQWPRWRMLSRLSGTEEFRDCGRYGRVQDVDGIRIFRFDAPLLFTNVEHFAKSVERAVTDCPPSGLATLHNVFAWNPSAKKSPAQSLIGRLSKSESEEEKAPQVHHLIIDCSGFTFVDYTSLSALADVYRQMKDRGINVYFAGAKAPVRDVLDACGFHRSVGKENFYPAIHDAVLAASQSETDHTTTPGTEVINHSQLLLPLNNSTILNSKSSVCIKESSLLEWEQRKRLDECDDL
jgi:MFS superfamily sulfate permease-like transporter